MHWTIVWIALSAIGKVWSYTPDIHQSLTFEAARQLNECLATQNMAGYNALQVRYIARANYQLADANLFVRMFRWNYYNREDADPRSTLWVIDTHLHEHFNELDARLLATERPATKRLADAGRIISYLQDVTTPAKAVPVFSNRWWRLSFSDRFDHYPVDEDALANALDRSCALVFARPLNELKSFLDRVAEETLAAVQSPIFQSIEPSLAPLTPEVSWEAFWRAADDPGDFGEYGQAGNNFGRAVEFECDTEEDCVLLKDDPMYRRFALERHTAAVHATMQVLLYLQERTDLEEVAELNAQLSEISIGE